MTLLICRTCPRYDPRTTGDFGRELAHTLTDLTARDPRAAGVPVRNVACLGGCPEDGVIALDGPGKARVRFTHLHPHDAPAVLAAAAAHHASPTGAPQEWAIPPELTDRIATITYKRPPAHHDTHPTDQPPAPARPATDPQAGR